MVAAENGIQVQVTPTEDCHGVFVQKKSRERIEIKELMKGKSNAKFDYLITAVRAGYQDHKPVVANTNFRPTANEKAKDFEARYAGEDMNTKAMRAMLISNGILTQDGGTRIWSWSRSLAGKSRRISWLRPSSDRNQGYHAVYNC